MLLKPCDTYSFNQLLKEHRINRGNVSTPSACPARASWIVEQMIRALGVKGILPPWTSRVSEVTVAHDVRRPAAVPGHEALLRASCLSCKSKEHRGV